MIGKRYLGDAVYADFDGYQIVLTTVGMTGYEDNKIYLEPAVFERLLDYVEDLQKENIEK